jgi:hypothetical protein
MKNLTYTLRIISLLLMWAALIWIARHPSELGAWYGKYQKAQIQEFNIRP